MSTIFAKVESSIPNSPRVMVINKTEETNEPVFKCEVCRISLRTAQKLQDHVKFSPLHQSWLNKTQEVAPVVALTTPTKKKTTRQRLVYEGTKLFWRINKTLDLTIHEDATNGIMTLHGVDSESHEESPQLILDLEKIERYVTRKSKLSCKPGDYKGINVREEINKFILARVTATLAVNKSVVLSLQKLHDDTYDTMLKETGNNEMEDTTPSVQRKRRHTLEDVQSAQNEFYKEKNALQSAREKAKRMSEATRDAINSFTDLAKSPRRSGTSVSKSSNVSDSWISAFNKIQLQGQVQTTRKYLSGMDN